MEKDPIKEHDLIFPKGNMNGCFSIAFYTRKRANKEKQDKRWLVYSKPSNKVFFFYCELFSIVQVN